METQPSHVETPPVRRTNWPARRLLVGLLLFLVVVQPFSGSCVCGRHPGTMAPVIGGLILIALRIVLAVVRREQSKVWIFYAALALLLPVLAELVVEVFGSH